MFPMGPQHGNNPFSFSFPFLFPFQQRSDPPPRPEIAPIRVRVAMEFLGMLDYKTMPRAAASDAVCIELETVVLEVEEKETRVKALKLLNSYFEGNYELSNLEKKAERERKEQEKENAELKQRLGGAGMVLRCVGCGNRPAPIPTCQFCKGTGEILVFPTYKPPTEEAEDA